MQSGDVLSTGGLDRVAARLAGRANPRVAVVGGSTSAAAVCHALLNRMPAVQFQPGGVTLLHRRELRIYYPDAFSALAEGYVEFGEDDICPISGKVFRFAGFRLDSRELIMQARGIGNRPPEPRLALRALQQPIDPVALRLLAEAGRGHRRHGVSPACFAGAEPRRPAAAAAGTRPVRSSRWWTGQCRVLDEAGAPVAGLYGIGLAAGFVPRGSPGRRAELPRPGQWAVAVAEGRRQPDRRRHLPGGGRHTSTRAAARPAPG